MDTATSKRIGKFAVKQGWVGVKDVNEAFRILAVRADVGEPVGLDQVLFERDLIDADQVFELQERLKLQLVFCHQCGAQNNVHGKSPGGTARCSCKAKLRVPGNDPEDPFVCVTRQDRKVAREKARPKASRGQSALGWFGVLPLGGLIGAAAVGGWETSLRIPTLVAAAGFLLLVGLLLKKRQSMAACGVGLAVLTALVVVAASGHEPGTVAVFGVGPHQLLGPLVLLHVGLLFLLTLPLLRRVESPWGFLLLYIPLGYALLFFASRCVPGVDPATLVAGPDALAQVPWYLHPGQVTFLGLFPLAALAIFGGGLKRHLRGGQRTLLRDGGLVLSLALLSCFGLTLASLKGIVPAPALRAEVGRTLAGRSASWMDPPKASTAVAVQVAPEGPAAEESSEGEQGS